MYSGWLNIAIIRTAKKKSKSKKKKKRPRIV